MSELIIELEKLSGKTIQTAKSLGYGSIGIVFSDSSYCIIHGGMGYDGDVSLELADGVDDVELHNLGVMSDEEYNTKAVAKKEAYAAEERNRRHKRYLELKSEFEGKS